MELEKAILLLREMQYNCMQKGTYIDPKSEQKAQAIEAVLRELYYLQKENEELKEIDLTTVHIKGVCDEKERWRNKIRDNIEKIEKRITKYKEYQQKGQETDVEYYENREDEFAKKVLQDLLKEE